MSTDYGPPQRRKDMLRANYELKDTRDCRYCGVAIEWWKTTKGRMLPFDLPKTQPPELEVAVVHKCSARAATPAATPRRELTLEQDQLRAVELLASQLKARVLVAILEDGTFRYTVQRGIPAEDVRHELITLANNLRRDLEAQQ